MKSHIEELKKSFDLSRIGLQTELNILQTKLENAHADSLEYKKIHGDSKTATKDDIGIIIEEQQRLKEQIKVMGDGSLASQKLLEGNLYCEM